MIRVGFSKCSISPDRPLDLWGYVERSGKSTGRLDDLYVRVLVIQNRSKTSILINFDLGGTGLEFVRTLKAYIKRKTGVSKRYIIVCSTHTHAAPAALFLRNCGAIDNDYLDFVKRQTLVAVMAAFDRVRRVRVGYGRGETDISVNRREKGVQSNRRQASGTVDPEIGVLRFSFDGDSRDIILVNFAAHPVTLRADNRKVSADYPGAVCRYIENELNADAIFLQGACADVNPKIFGTAAEMQQVGREIGQSAVTIARSISLQKLTKFEILPRKLFLSIETPPDRATLKQRIRQLRKMDNLEDQVWQLADLQWAEEFLDFLDSDNPAIPQKKAVNLQALKIAGILLVFVPGEIFVKTGLAIKKGEMADKICLVGYANDCSIGYLPTLDTIANGGYEVNSAYRFYGLFHYGDDSEKRIRESVLQMIGQLRGN